jgi:colicin import membrane protein
MKKIIIAIAILLGTVGFVHAQATTTAPKTTKKEKKAKTTTTTTTVPATTVQTKGTKKNGTPDMRLKANKVKATTPATTAAPAAAPTAATKSVKAPKTKAAPAAALAATAKTADKAIGTDAKGRTIYQGPRGGKYYINKNGNKEYVK